MLKKWNYKFINKEADGSLVSDISNRTMWSSWRKIRDTSRKRLNESSMRPSIRVVADEDNISYMKSLLFVDCVRVFNLDEWMSTDGSCVARRIYLFIYWISWHVVTGIHLHHIEMSYINKEYCLLVNGKIWIFQKWDENMNFQSVWNCRVAKYFAY